MTFIWGAGLFLVGIVVGAFVTFLFHSTIWREYVMLLDLATKFRSRVEELPEDLRKELIALLEGKD